MNISRKIILTCIFLFTLGCFVTMDSVKAQGINDDIIKAFREADASLLSVHFNKQITINIEGEEQEMSLEEAKEKLDAFFRSSTVKNFYVKFRGEKRNSNFMIGTLICAEDTYRVNIFLKTSDSGNKIQLLRIEEENESSF